MPDETLIAEIENILGQVIELGAEKERTRMVPNLLVTNDSPTGQPNFIIVKDDRDGDNILATKIPGIIYSTNDLVNVLFVRGAEAIAFQQGSQSGTSGMWDTVLGTSTDIYYNKGDVGIGKSVAPDAALEILNTAQSQLRLTFQEDTKYADFTVDTNHTLTIDPSSTGQIKLASVDVTIEEDLIHEGDTDTKIIFTDDDIEFTAGNLSMLKLTEAAQDLITLGPGSGDVDIDFNGDMTLQGSDGRVAINQAVTALARLKVFEDDFAAPLNSAIIGEVDTTSATANYQIYALQGTARFRGTVGSTNAAGVRAIDASMFYYNTGSTVQVSGFRLDGRNLGTGTVQNFNALLIPTMLNTGGGTINNIYGLKVNSQTAATNNYGVHQSGTGMINWFEGKVGVGTGAVAPAGKLHVDQESTTGAMPVAYFDQADVSEEMFEFNTTIGVGNAIEAVGAKALTTTHFVKVTLPGALTRYFPVGTIA